MNVEFDPAKDALNIAKHGISLAQALDLLIFATERDSRFAIGEVRYRAFGLLDGYPHCLACTMRGETIRAISLRRAHLKEFRRYVS